MKTECRDFQSFFRQPHQPLTQTSPAAVAPKELLETRLQIPAPGRREVGELLASLPSRLSPSHLPWSEGHLNQTFVTPGGPGKGMAGGVNPTASIRADR